MSKLLRPLCLVSGHEPDRQKIRHDGEAFIGNCRRCGTPLARDPYQRWIQDDRGVA